MKKKNEWKIGMKYNSKRQGKETVVRSVRISKEAHELIKNAGYNFNDDVFNLAEKVAKKISNS